MNNIVISLDETYHLLNDKPLYSNHFDKVQSFHFPLGYAPVISDKCAFFINIKGKSVFGRQFKKAYGFYDGIATVADEYGFFHVDEQGKDIHSQRFAWSGNFQEGLCAVEDIESKQFFHIDKKGNPIYVKKYAYVGDYRYGVAVITNNNGICTHIDAQGQLLHGKYFLELDVYHKGYAIAKDEQGYFHINKKGEEIYKNRYLKLEPFYNDRAIAIDFYEIKNIISISGETIKEIDSHQNKIRKIEKYYVTQAFSYWHGRILNSILELGVFEQLKTTVLIDTLYQQLNLPEKSIDMILRWLIIQKLIIINNNFVSLTVSGQTIEDKLKSIISYWQSRELVLTSIELADSLTTHQSYFEKLYQTSFFEYTQKNKKTTEDLKSVMNYYSIDYSCHLNYLSLSSEIVCDIGGGNGDLLSKLQVIYPKIIPIILDKFDYRNNNIKVIQGDFFEKWLVKADIYLMSRVLHDWDDDKVIQLLNHVADNMNHQTIFYIFETIIDKDNTIDKGITISFHLLNLLGGRERTLAEFSVLFQSAGLQIKDIYLMDSIVSLIKVIKI